MDDASEIAEETLKIMLSSICEDRASNNSDSRVSQESSLRKIVSDDTAASETTVERADSDSLILRRVLSFDDPTLIINIGSFAFQTNMEVLEMYSDFMKANNDLKEINLPIEKVSPIAFVAIYEWMLCENPRLPRKGIIELYKGASYLGVSQLLAQFWQCISNPLINEDRAYLMYLEALAFDVPEIRKTMLSRISKFFLAIVACEEFLHMPVEDVRTLVRSNLIAVNSELEIYYACVKYFNFNWTERRDHLFEVMQCVRFDFLPTNFLLELLNDESELLNKEISRMVDHPELQNRLRDLVDYYCLAAFPGPNTVSIEKSPNRKWIYDAKCNYHARETPQKTNPTYILYIEFSEYMCFLCLASTKHWESFEVLPIETEEMNTEQGSKMQIIE